MSNPADPPTHALSFAGVADAYERARPSYPEEAATWRRIEKALMSMRGPHTS